MQWAEVDGKHAPAGRRQVNRFIPNPTFDPVARPGSLDEYFRGRNARGGHPRLSGSWDRSAPRTATATRALAVMDARV